MLYFFPQLEAARITHAWSGKCAATNDLLPHVGNHGGVHFAIGYCFSGLAMAPYLGEKAAAGMLGDHKSAETVVPSE
jgi:glycine/D-amino acid oxidase-like deaminating enzyme